jgi:hypothetical protein
MFISASRAFKAKSLHLKLQSARLAFGLKFDTLDQEFGSGTEPSLASFFERGLQQHRLNAAEGPELDCHGPNPFQPPFVSNRCDLPQKSLRQAGFMHDATHSKGDLQAVRRRL